MSVDDSTAPTTVDEPFPSLAAMRAAHRELLQNRREGDNPAFLADVVAFLARGQAAGAVLEEDEERQSGQSLLNFWSNALYRANGETVDATLRDFDSSLAPDIPDEANPYRGLDAFGEEHQSRFFGRQQLVADAIERLGQQRLLAVVGPSGSGKSSLVRAGLIPALKGGALPESEHWAYLPPIVPGSEPLAALARLLQPPDTSDDGWVAVQVATLSEDPTHLTRLIEERFAGVALLTIDQFEETFTLCEDNTARQAFINSLLHLAQSPNRPHRVVLTMRSDFETFVARVARLQALFAAGRLQVTPLNAAELREAIERPAEQVGLKFESGLVEALLQDILGEPAALPLLQFTLLKLWEQRDHNRVTMEAYRQVGGGRLALARSADALYNSLIPEDQVTARRILLRLVRPGEGLEVTSSRVRRAALLRAGEDPGRVNRVLGRLLAARLLRLTPGAVPEDDTVEVAHEALVRNWPTLVDWLDEERSAIATRRRLEERAREWVRLGRARAGLFDEVQLVDAERWLRSAEAADLGYDQALADMVAASRAALREEIEAQEAARQREIEQVRALAEEQRLRAESQARASRLLRLLVTALAVLAVVALVAAVVAVQAAAGAIADRGNAVQARQTAEQAATALAAEVTIRSAAEATARASQGEAQRNAEEARKSEAAALAAQQTAVAAGDEALRQARLARGGQLAAVAQIELAEHPQRSLLLALEALAATGGPPVDDSPPARALLGALRSVSGRGLGVVGGPITALVVAPDSQRVVAASGDGSVHLWQLGGDGPPAPPVTLGTLGSLVSHIALTPDGRRLAAAAGGNIQIWDLSAPDPGASGQTASFTGGTISALVWSPDGGRLIGGDVAGGLFVWTLSESGQPGEPQALQRHPGAITALAACPDGRWLLSGNDGDGVARRWSFDNLSTAPFRFTTGRDTITALACSPDSRTFITGSDDGRVSLWPTGAGSSVSADVFVGHEGVVTDAAFSPDSQWVATASDDTTVRLWRVNSPQNQRLLIGHTNPITDLAWAPDGQRLATSSADGTTRLWDISRPDAPTISLRGHENEVLAVAVTPDGRQILTGGADGSLRAVDAANPLPAADAALAAAGSLPADPQALTLGDLARVVNPVELACRTAGRNLSRDEWTRLLGPREPYRPTCPNLPFDQP